MKPFFYLGVVALIPALVAACTVAEELSSSPVATQPAVAESPQTNEVVPTPKLVTETPLTPPPVKPTEEASRPTLAPSSPTVSTATPVPDPIATGIPVAPPVQGPRLTGRVALEELRGLYTRHGLDLDPGVQTVSVHSLDGKKLASQETIGLGGEFSFTISENSGYLLKARTVGGINIWALAHVRSEDTTQDINLRTTYESGLIFASNTDATISRESINSLKEAAGQALDLGADRLVNTVERVLDNAH